MQHANKNRKQQSLDMDCQANRTNVKLSQIKQQAIKAYFGNPVNGSPKFNNHI